MTENEIRLRKAISQAAQRGFEWFSIKSSRGDSNCPYPLPYSPKDGHGYEDREIYFDTDSEGKGGFFDEETKSEDILTTLARAFESFPEIIDRPPRT